MSVKVIIQMSARRALFNDPRFPDNRLSYLYPVFPSVLGAVQAIYWKPEANFTVERIGILNAGQRVAHAFNHTKEDAVIKGGYVTDRRNTSYLEDVQYLVEVAIQSVNGQHDDTLKHAAILKKRLVKGSFYTQPFMGAREMPADCELVSSFNGHDFTTELDTAHVVLPDGFNYLPMQTSFAKKRTAIFSNFAISNGIMERVNNE